MFQSYKHAISGDKYGMKEVQNGTKNELTLTIKKVEKGDFISYSCHALNPIGHAEGTILLYGLKFFWFNVSF